jgi:FixJ family two-component response regulator
MRAEHTSPEIFIVDDDPSVRELLSTIFSLEGYQVCGFDDGTSLLAAARSRVPTCIILDVAMPGRSGIDILKELNAQEYPAPILIISGKSNTGLVVDAIKHGALDFIEKPFELDAITARVREAIEGAARRGQHKTASDVLDLRFPGCETLTRRECEILAQIVEGATSKAAGRHLGISSRTVEVHRARIMQKLGARNATDLMRIVLSEGHRH